MKPDLPTGTVTFLFTDIEGSTKLWQKYPDAMPNALKTHHAILSETITAHGGYVFQIIGDAFCAAFTTATNGLDAALAAQRALRDATWGETGSIRVRMALHTGAADLRVGEYTSGEYISGLTLSRASRLLSAGHGGQILLSLLTAELAREHLPPETILHDLNLHRLKDLDRPEHIYQVVVPDLDSEFLPLKTLDTQPNNLPIQLTSFIGREQDMVRVKDIMNRTRIITLTGVGGSGKTRLAIQIAADIIDEFPDGVWIVELAPLDDPTLVPYSVTTALGLQLQYGRTIQLALTEYLHERICLLVFDNCEHLIDTCARLIDTLVRACPNLKILSTSREGFGIPGEVVYNIPSLAIPSLETLTAQSLSQYESVRLFYDRALSIQPNFSITDQNATAIAQICNQLDGIPLAIELAAARVNVLSVEQISERLVDRFRLLTGGSRTALPRQQTLRALIDWSYSLLSPVERILFERLSVFTGGWTLEAAESICAGDGIESIEVLDSLITLVAKSLVGVTEGLDDRVRYTFLQTIRLYAHEKLINSKQLDQFRNRHLNWFLDFEERARPKLFNAEQVVMLNRLDAEHDNFRTALAWSIETAIEKGLRLAAGLYRFWRLRGYWFERRDWLKKLLAHPDALAPSLARAYALVTLGDIEFSQGEYTNAEESFTESLQIYRHLSDEKGIAAALGELARLSIQKGNFLQAGELSRESLEISRKIEDKFQISQATNRLGYVLRTQGNQTGANELLDESKTLLSQMVDMGSIQNFFPSPETQNAYFNLALSAQEQGNFINARQFFEGGLAFFRKTGSSHEIAWFLRYLANLSLREGDLALAQARYQESLQIVQALKDKYCTSHTLESLARVEIGKGNYDQAASFALQALNLAEQVGSKQRIAQVQRTLGLAMRSTDPLGAEQMLRSSLTMSNKLGNKIEIADSLEALAKLNLLSKSFERTTMLFGAVSVLREAISFSMTPAERSESDLCLSTLRTELGNEAFTTVWEEGRALSLEQAIKLGLSEGSV